MKKPRCETNRDVIQHIDPTKKVRVYRNLHRKCISVKQGGIVRCWTTNVVLKDCKFIISKAGQKRVRDEKRKKKENEKREKNAIAGLKKLRKS